MGMLQSSTKSPEKTLQDVIIHRVSPLHTVHELDGTFTTTEPLKMFIHIPGVLTETIEVPPYFNTDFSSIPTVVAWFVDWRRVAISGIIHDFLYAEVGHNQFPGMSRRIKDKVWREVSQSTSEGALAANKGQAYLGYLVLRVAGWIFDWRKKNG